jgi:hypothetical protein
MHAYYYLLGKSFCYFDVSTFSGRNKAAKYLCFDRICLFSATTWISHCQSLAPELGGNQLGREILLGWISNGVKLWVPATSLLSNHDQRVLIYLVIISMLTQVMMFLFEYYFSISNHGQCWSWRSVPHRTRGEVELKRKVWGDWNTLW